jgi:hypothetical protein
VFAEGYHQLGSGLLDQFQNTNGLISFGRDPIVSHKLGFDALSALCPSCLAKSVNRPIIPDKFSGDFAMLVRFWGTRGSIATPGGATLRYGGNTACVEAMSDSGTTLLIDAGTGANALGKALMEQGRAAHGHILIQPSRCVLDHLVISNGT